MVIVWKVGFHKRRVGNDWGGGGRDNRGNNFWEWDGNNLEWWGREMGMLGNEEEKKWEC